MLKIITNTTIQISRVQLGCPVFVHRNSKMYIGIEVAVKYYSNKKSVKRVSQYYDLPRLYRSHRRRFYTLAPGERVERVSQYNISPEVKQPFFNAIQWCLHHIWNNRLVFGFVRNIVCCSSRIYKYLNISYFNTFAMVATDTTSMRRHLKQEYTRVPLKKCHFKSIR